MPNARLPVLNQMVGAGLSAPSKMPGPAYSLPTTACNVGTKLRDVEGSVCHGCYAHERGFYRMPNVKNALAARLSSLKAPWWEDAMVELIEHSMPKGEDRFRWHDSGDLQGQWHLDRIVNIAKRMPHIRFYLPTKEYKLARANVGRLPSNLIMRVSAPMIDQSPADWADHSSMVVGKNSETPEGVFLCPAQHQGHKCLDCDACWDSAVKTIGYPVH